MAEADTPDTPNPDARQAALRRLADSNPQRRGPAELPPDAGFEVRDRRFCLGCGTELTDLEDANQCPHCGRGFDPADDSTYADEPPPTLEVPYWRQPPRLAGYALLTLVLAGRLVIHAVAGPFASGLDSVGGAVVGPILVVFVFVPWIIGCLYLGLLAAAEFYGPRLGASILVALALAVVITLGLAPVLTVMALLLAPFVGLLRAWREL